MYRCKECGSEYKIKPDYCDCGNDTFDEIIEEVENLKQETIVQNKPEPKVEKKQEEEPNYYKKEIQKKVPLTFEERYPELARLKDSLDPISVAIFTGCILLSLIIIFFVGNPKERQISTVQNTTKTTTSTKNIPTANSFWNNSTEGVVSDSQTETQAQPQQQVQQPTPIQPQPVVVQPKIKVIPVITKILPIVKPQPIKQVAKPTTKPIVKAPVKKVISQPKKIAKSTTTSNGQDLSMYKMSLRNTIGRKISFVDVVGDGNCTVSFKVNSSGRLTNRAFAKQSSNITLNDAVYNAVMSTPSYNPPPSSYRNETMHLKVNFYDGNFEISLY